MRDSQDSTTFLHRRRRTDVAMSMEITSLHLRFSSGEQVLKKTELITTQQKESDARGNANNVLQ